MARSNHRSKRRASGHIFSPSTLVSNGAVSVTASSRSFKQWSFRRTPPSAVRVSFDRAHQWCMLNITMWLLLAINAKYTHIFGSCNQCRDGIQSVENPIHIPSQPNHTPSSSSSHSSCCDVSGENPSADKALEFGIRVVHCYWHKKPNPSLIMFIWLLVGILSLRWLLLKYIQYSDLQQLQFMNDSSLKLDKLLYMRHV
nr:hypothetical protein Iba_chr15cCG9140 [Ipomoea batatas]